MAISNKEFLVETLDRLLKTGLVPSAHTCPPDISEEVPTCVYTTLVTNFDSDQACSIIEDVDNESEFYDDDLRIGEISIRPAGKAHLFIVLMF